MVVKSGHFQIWLLGTLIHLYQSVIFVDLFLLACLDDGCFPILILNPKKILTCFPILIFNPKATLRNTIDQLHRNNGQTFKGNTSNLGILTTSTSPTFNRLRIQV